MRITEESQRNDYNNIWVVADTLNSSLQKVTLELIGEAKRLANDQCCEVWTVLMGYNNEHIVEKLQTSGANAIINIDDQRLANFNDEMQAAVLTNLIHKYKPEIILTGATATGRALIPRVAILADCGLTADCTDLSIDSETGALHQTRPAFGGNLMATIKSDTHLPQMATVRPGVMKPAEKQSTLAKVIEEKITADIEERKRIIKTVINREEEIDFSEAEFVIAGGRGINSKEGFQKLKELGAPLNAAIGATRAAVDAGWVPYATQIGQTGVTVQPKIYIACAISGQIQHLVGMQSSDYIIAINKDPKAPIMEVADLAITGDVFEVLPVLIEEFNKHKQLQSVA